MGRMGVIEMRKWAAEEKALEWHLSSNHYPSQVVWLKAARTAIKLGRQGKVDAKVQLPPGIAEQNGDKFGAAGKIINHLHLEDFITEIEEKPEEGEDGAE